MKNGIANSTGGTSAPGDLAGLGVGLGAMSSIMNMTKDALSPMAEEGIQMGKAMDDMLRTEWNCSCGQRGNSCNFCSNCGRKRSE